jgi:uncharacterized repeat protein (TIGR01451 family)
MYFFDTGDAVPYDPEGWYIDDVRVQHTRTADCFNADLKIEKSAVEDTVIAGNTLNYFVTVTNLGADNRSGANPGQQDASTSFRMVDTLPTGTAFVDARQIAPPPGSTAPPCAVNVQQVTCAPSLPNGGLVVGGSVTWQISVRVNPDFDGSLVENIARVTAQQPRDKNQANDESRVITPVQKLADLGIAKLAAPTPVAAGGLLTYSLVVTNFGPSASGPFTVSDTLPGNVELLTLSPGCIAAGAVIACSPPAASLAPGASLIWNFTVWVDPNAVDGNVVVNRARINHALQNDPRFVRDRNPANDTAETVTPVIGAADLKLEKRGVATIVPGGLITYTLTVTNLGPSPSGSFTVRDTLPANTTFAGADGCSLAAGVLTCEYRGVDLLPTQTTSWIVTVRVNPGLPSSELVENCAQLTERSRPDLNPENDYACVCSVIVEPPSKADLGIAKTGSPATVVAGGNITYTLSVTNFGETPVAAFSVVDVLPIETTFVSATPAGCTFNGNQLVLQCAYAGLPLAPNAATSWTVTVQSDARLNAGYVIENRARLEEPYCIRDNNPWNCVAVTRTTIEGRPPEPPKKADLAIDKTAVPDPVVAGGQLTYTLTVRNTGPDSSGPFTVLDAIPIEIVAGSVVPPPGCEFRAPDLVCRFTGSLAVNAATSWTVQVTVDPALGAGYVISNVASIAERSVPDGNPWNDIARTRTIVAVDADLELRKSGPSGPVKVGDRVTYALTVTNRGLSNNQGFQVLDRLPVGVAFVRMLTGPIGACTSNAAAGTVTCTAPVLNAGSSITWSFEAQVTAIAEPACEDKVNTATIEQNRTPDSNSVNNTATARTRVDCPNGEQTIRFVTLFSPPDVGALASALGKNIPETYPRPVLRPGRGAIYGYRWFDARPNGVWDSNEQGLGGRVIYVDIDGNGIYDPENETGSVTAIDGSYVFDDLLPGSYSLREDSDFPILALRGKSIQTFPANPSHVIVVSAGRIVEGVLGVNTSPNFGAYDSADLVRPAYDQIGCFVETVSGADCFPRGSLTESAQQRAWLERFDETQRITFSNNTATPLTISFPTLTNPLSDPERSSLGLAMLTFVRLNGDILSVQGNRTLGPPVFPLTVPPNQVAFVYVFFTPAVGERFFPDWHGGKDGVTGFGDEERLVFSTNQDSRAIPVNLVGTSTFDGDIDYSLAVDVGDINSFQIFLNQRDIRELHFIDTGSRFYDPSFEINLRCVNSNLPFENCPNPYGGVVVRGLGNDDMGALNVDSLSDKVVLDLDEDDSRGAIGSDVWICSTGKSKIVDDDVEFIADRSTQLKDVLIKTATATIVNTLPGEQLVVSSVGLPSSLQIEGSGTSTINLIGEAKVEDYKKAFQSIEYRVGSTPSTPRFARVRISVSAILRLPIRPDFQLRVTPVESRISVQSACPAR